jgi:hypothetical protein
MVAQEIAIGSGADSYCFGKALDPLGVLSHSGALRKCAALALTDFDLSAARGKSLTSETVKRLLDVAEGGTLQDCRWRSCILPPGKLPRLLALNGEPDSYGSWFAKYDQRGLAMTVGRLDGATDPAVAREIREVRMRDLVLDARRLSGDEQAALRRVGLAFCRQSLVAEEAAATMRADTAERAAAARARRAAHWARHSA